MPGGRFGLAHLMLLVVAVVVVVNVILALTAG
jgi:hypothetical protein